MPSPVRHRPPAVPNDSNGRSSSRAVTAERSWRARSKSMETVRDSRSQNAIWAGRGFSRFPKKCASTSRRNMGQSLSSLGLLSADKIRQRKQLDAHSASYSSVVRRCQSSEKGATPRITDITSKAHPGGIRVPATEMHRMAPQEILCFERRHGNWLRLQPIESKRPTDAGCRLPTRRRYPYRG